jgi:hypothetical protein
MVRSLLGARRALSHHVSRGAAAEVILHLRNFSAREQTHRIEIHAPPGLIVEPGTLGCKLAGETRRAFSVRIQANAEAKPGVYLVAFDITLDGHRYGEWFDCIVEVRP